MNRASSLYDVVYWVVSNRAILRFRNLKKATTAFVEHRIEHPDTPVTLLKHEHTGHMPAYETIVMEYSGGTKT